MTFLIFLGGMVVGSGLTVVVAFGLIYRKGAAKLDNISNDISKTAEKLVQARKRFGQIATRDSIGAARKIANQALKELAK